MRHSDTSTTATIAELIYGEGQGLTTGVGPIVLPQTLFSLGGGKPGPRNEAAVLGVEHERWQFDRLAERVNLRARHGFQQQARIPCYRGVRTR